MDQDIITTICYDSQFAVLEGVNNRLHLNTTHSSIKRGGEGFFFQGTLIQGEVIIQGFTGRFPFDQKFRKFRVKSEWKGHFPEYHFGILGVPRELVPIFRKIGITGGAFHSTKNSGYSRWGSEWNRHFPEFHSEILGVPRESE